MSATADASIGLARADLLNLLIDSVRPDRAGDAPVDPALTAPATRESSPRGAAGQ
jgi:hypothetical protein